MIIILIVSFLLQSLLSNFIGINTNLFNPTFPIIALLIIYPYFKKENKKYLIYSVVYGLLYDLFYTETFILYAFIFFLIALLIIKLNKYFSKNIINIIIMTILIVISYRVIVYTLLVLINYLSFNIFVLFKSIYSSLILNILYAVVLYVLYNRKQKNI